MSSLMVFDKVYRDFEEGENVIHALKETSFEINRGEFIAIVGPSGSGKSTMLTLMGGLQTPSGGEILLNGKAYHDLSQEDLIEFRFEEIGFILQSSNLVPYLNLEEQFRLVDRYAKRPHDKEKAESLMDSLGIKKLAKSYPADMSGGERQRAAICRALYTDPSLILADEPTASLDTEKAFEVIKIIAEKTKKNNIAAVMVTHDRRLLEQVDRVFEVTDGVLKEADVNDPEIREKEE